MADISKYILVTGTNGGLGLGICCRLIDDFISTRPQTASLTLIFTTRSSRKSTETLRTLQDHLSKHGSSAVAGRVHLRPENVELTNLLSVRTLAKKLTESDVPKLDAIILNAGIAGFSGIDWFTAIPDIILDIRTSTTWPRYKLAGKGLVAPAQFSGPPTPGGKEISEPPLGQIFCANVFGHYMLAHWLMPLLRACDASEPGRIIWVSSIEARARHFNEDDLQCFQTDAAYEHTKRLSDILALTYDQPATSHAVTPFRTFLSSTQKRPNNSNPTMHVGQPGVFPTTIISLPWIVYQFYILGILLARLVGSPWASLTPYTAATVMSWLALTPATNLKSQEASFSNNNTKSSRNGRVKWGTAVTRLGVSTERPSEVEGWGLNGSGEPFGTKWWAGKLGRAPDAKDATREDVEEFLRLGSRTWTKMEDLRKEWEERIAEYDFSQL